MAKIDVSAFLEQCGIRKARFGGYEPEDVHLAMQAFGEEYEERMARLEEKARKLQTANTALEKHCQTLVTQNRMLTDQNVSLAGGNEKFSRQARDYGAQASTMKERNRSLTNQNAVLTLKNGDLEKENKQLKESAEQARAALTVKGQELDRQKNELQQSKESVMAAARAQAQKTIVEARESAKKIEELARSNAVAVEHTAREQAQEQAQKLVESASSEANEIRNIQQLRLASLKAEVARMETTRDDLIQYLRRMSTELRNIEEVAKSADPTALPQEVPGQMELEMKPAETPVAQLDLTPETVAKTAAKLSTEDIRLAAGAAGEEENRTDDGFAGEFAPQNPETPDFPETPDSAEPTFDTGFEATESAAPANLSSGEGGHNRSSAETVPGAIFSSPIVNPEPEPIVPVRRPKPGVRQPVMPVLPQEDDAESNLPRAESLFSHGLRGVSERRAVAAAPQSVGAVRRRRAVDAVRELHRIRREHAQKF